MTEKQRKLICQSSRLALYSLSVEDADAVYRYRIHPEVALYQTWTLNSPRDVTDYANEMAKRKPFTFGEVEQIVLMSLDTKEVIGDLAVTIDTDTNQTAELGVAINPCFQKQGYGFEALKTLCEFLFNEMNLHRIHVAIDPRNNASLNLFEKLTFRTEGHLIESYFHNGEWTDDVLMGVLKREWMC